MSLEALWRRKWLQDGLILTEDRNWLPWKETGTAGPLARFETEHPGGAQDTWAISAGVAGRIYQQTFIGKVAFAKLYDRKKRLDGSRYAQRQGATIL